MGIYKYISDLWKKPKRNMPELYKERLVAWRAEPATVKIDKPTRLDKARTMGYRAKPGIFVVRQRVPRGGRQREQIRHPRKTKKMRRVKIVAISYQVVAERRANMKFENCEVLNSYWVGQDGKNYWYEVILVDRYNPSITSDRSLAWITTPANHRRAFRGLTSAGKKSRGLSTKGKGSEKARPSIRANGRRAH